MCHHTSTLVTARDVIDHCRLSRALFTSVLSTPQPTRLSRFENKTKFYYGFEIKLYHKQMVGAFQNGLSEAP